MTMISPHVLSYASCTLVIATFILITYCWTVQVETIGDAYMVSSGIPISNTKHAPELADMALTLCHEVTKFKVKIAFYRMIGRHQSINQSINLFVQKCNRHWTGH